MGREAEAHLICTDAQGGAEVSRAGHGKIILEAQEIILRGDLRRRIARGDITAFHTDGDDLVITTARMTVRAALGTAEALRWAAALAKPAPSLRDKLGIGAAGIRVVGALDIPELRAAVAGECRDDSPLMIAQIGSLDDMTAIIALLNAAPAPQFWGVVAKGKAAAFSDADLRSHLRRAGYIDSKSCSIPPDHSATRYGRRK